MNLATFMLVAVIAQPGPLVAREPTTLPAAIAAGERNIVVSGDGEPLEDTLVIPEGVVVRCAEGVTITCRFSEAKPCIEIRNGTITGCKLVADWQGGERQPNYRTFHGLSVYGHSATVTDCEVVGFDDNFYAGPLSPSDRTPAKFNIQRSIFRNGFRQGISVVSGIGLIEDCTVEGTVGASPQAGIDIEPSHKDDVVQVTVRRLHSTSNKGSGILINLDRVANDSPPPRIIFEDCKVGDTTVQHQEVRLAQMLQENGLPLDRLPKGTLVQVNGIAYVKRPK